MATTPGQPTRYKPEYCELAHNYSLLGATGDTLADFFGVATRTIDNWIATHPDFADAVYRGRAAAAPAVSATRSRSLRSIRARCARSRTRWRTRPTARPACSG